MKMMTFLLSTMLFMMVAFTFSVTGEAKEEEVESVNDRIMPIPAEEMAGLLRSYELKVVPLDQRTTPIQLQEEINEKKMDDQELSLFAAVNSTLSLEQASAGQNIILLKKK